MSESKLSVLLGELPIQNFVSTPYNQMAMDFVCDFGSALRKNKKAIQFSDIMALAFWCRKSNLMEMRNKFAVAHARIGVGTVFHVTPSNVPVNFVFSFLFGLLAGNGNVVRVPSKHFSQTSILISVLSEVANLPQYADIKKSNAFVSYAQDNDITKEFSLSCNARIVWGGDNAINSIRSCGLAPRAREITFADRYSFAIIDAEAIQNASNDELNRLAGNFYNDTFLMDQNACSSPHLILWTGKDVENAKKKFWGKVSVFADSKYVTQPINSVDKYAKACSDCMACENVTKVERYGNNVLLVQLEKLAPDIDKMRGKCGYFFEFAISNFSEVLEIVNEKYQTLSYFGVCAEELKQAVLDFGAKGIDRIVPIGKALDIGVVWDGFDVIGTLSRIINVV